jgi:hypothetical protein
MTIQTAEATLTLTATTVCLTSFQEYRDGYIDVNTGFIKAVGTGTWSQLSGTTWNDFTNFVLEPQEIRWTSPLIDLGDPRYFTLNIDLDCAGGCSFLVSVSSTGAFNGEHKEILIRNNDINVPSFYGQFVYVTAFVTGQELRRMTITNDTSYDFIRLQDVNSSTLPGSNTARTIVLPRSVSSIVDIVIQPKAATSYPVNLYVSDTATSTVVIPIVLSKNRLQPTFALYGIDNDPRDAVVDILVTALPRMVMENNNLFVIQ